MKGKSKLSVILVFACLSIFITLKSCTANDQDQLSIEGQLLTLLEDSSLDKNVLIINGIDENGQIIYEVKDGFEFAFEQTRVPGDEICHGSGYSYARCVRTAMDNGMCLFTYSQGGEYVAEEAECPPNR